MPCFFIFLPWLLAFVLAVGKGMAQNQPVPEQGLAIGQAVPDVALHSMVNYPAPSAKLSDFKGKLLILDFWATWCGTCLGAMPKLDALQQELGDQLQIILVNTQNTRDTEEKVLEYFDKRKNPDGQKFRLPSAINDSTLLKLFPHQLIPHYVWIGTDGKVKAITSSEQVTAENIRQVLADSSPRLSLKKDLNLQYPLFSDPDLPADNLVHYAIFLRGKMDGLPGGIRYRKSGDTVHGIALMNTPVISMYKKAGHMLFPDLKDKGLVLELGKPDGSDAPLCSFDFVVPPHQADRLYQLMLDELNKYSGYHGRIEKRKTDCLLLVRKGRHDSFQSKGGKPANRLYSKESPQLMNMPLSLLVARLNSADALALPVLDATRYTGTVDLEINAPFNDLPALRKELQRYGLDLVKARRKIEMLVVSEKPEGATR